ncbi:MAG: dimethylargininase [Deltaproteobacteria bacterium]|nr:dimethylargininase [Deltaproteobacteria bacterium]
MRAVVRAVPTSFANALCANPPPEPIYLGAARAQHTLYCTALLECGVKLIRVPADEDHPDCCFVEDTAVVVGNRALITRPGAPTRRGEVRAIAIALEHSGLDVLQMTEPATLDGGDCMRVGKTIFVGKSARTNAAAIARLAEVFPELWIVPIDLPPHVLHLKCVVSPLGGDRVLLADGTLDPKRFSHPVIIPAEETYAANCVSVGDHAIVADGFPRTLEAIRKAGLSPHPVPTSEVRKADGSLTCQSILLDVG